MIPTKEERQVSNTSSLVQSIPATQMLINRDYYTRRILIDFSDFLMISSTTNNHQQLKVDYNINVNNIIFYTTTIG